MKFSALSVAQRQKWDKADAETRKSMIDMLDLTEVPGTKTTFGAWLDNVAGDDNGFGGNTYVKQITVPAVPTKYGSFMAVVLDNDELRFIKAKSFTFFAKHVAACQRKNIEFGVTASANEDGDTVLTATSGLGFNLYKSELDGVMRDCIGTNQYPIVLAQTSDPADLANGGVL